MEPLGWSKLAMSISSKVLIVDDSMTQRAIVRRACIMAGVAPEDIDEAFDGQVALDKIQVFTPRLVLCDINMPRMTGLELLDELKSRGFLQRLRIAFITSQFDANTTSQLRAAGASALLQKPFTQAQLQQLLQHLLR